MHSSRMRTFRNSSRLRGVPGVGVPGVVGPSPGGCTWSQGGAPSPRGVPGLEGVPGPGECTWSQGGTCPVLPSVDRHTCVKT